jgi:hypothetical protein
LPGSATRRTSLTRSAGVPRVRTRPRPFGTLAARPPLPRVEQRGRMARQWQRGRGPARAPESEFAETSATPARRVA